MADVMIDIETASTKRNGLILSVAAVKFDPFSDQVFDGIYLKPDLESQLQIGRIADDSTIEWWAKQDEAIRNESWGDEDRLPLDQFLEQFNKFVWNSKKYWAKGPTFDMIIMEDFYASQSRPVPWKYHEVRDVRTIYDLAPELIITNTEAHNCLADCVVQIEILQKIFKKLGIDK